MSFNTKTVNWVNEEILIEGRNAIQKKLREVQGMISKESIDKKDEKKIMGYIRDAINLLNKTYGF